MTGTMPASGGASDWGYDANGRTVRHEWRNAASATITSYLSTYNGPGGVGTNRRASEERVHLGAGRVDTYSFDSAYRMVGFDRGAFGGIMKSTRELDGVDKMYSFDDEGTARKPDIDGVASQAGLNQYSEFDNLPRTYDRNGGLKTAVTSAGGEYRFDALKRMSEVRDGATLEMHYAYDAMGRRIAKMGVDSGSVPSVTERFYYDGGWRVLEETDQFGALSKQFVDGAGIDEHLQYKSFAGNAVSTYFYHCNDQGFVGALTDGNGLPQLRTVRVQVAWYCRCLGCQRRSYRR